MEFIKEDKNMDYTSAYYDSFNATLEKYGIAPEAIPYVGETLQTVEEMFFGFSMFLII